MDLSTIEGLELSEDQQKAILALHEETTKGIKANRDSLLEEKRKASEIATEAERKAKEAADKAALAEAKRSGDLAALEKTLSEQAQARINEAMGEVDRYKNLALGGKKESIINELASSFVSPDAAKMILAQLVEVGVNENNEAVSTFKDASGNLVSTDAKVFADWIKKQDAFKPLIKGVESSGGGAAGGSRGSSGAATSGDDWRAKRIAETNAKFNK